MTATKSKSVLQEKTPVRQNHRSSSAVEGHYGHLSQMYHNGRGLTGSRLKV
ncbi:DUF6399 domain-containing protein [Methylobacter svalbardensis]|uniref:DUF6399 domain-containing protein n=1 Tax=Methylobacter svalbardensis TaxID=3080016 RepID=UPI003BB76F7B